MSRKSTKNKKYALRKIGKVFGSCVVATVLTLGGAAIMAPSVTVYASDNDAGGGDLKGSQIFHLMMMGMKFEYPKGRNIFEMMRLKVILLY